MSALLVLVFLGIADAACPSGWQLSGGQCFGVFAGPLTFDNAKSACGSMNAELAKITSFSQNQVVSSRTGSNTITWIGYNDLSSEGSWKWEDRTLGSYTNWHIGEPNSWEEHDEDCAAMKHESIVSSAWFDYKCQCTFAYACSATDGFTATNTGRYTMATTMMSDQDLGSCEYFEEDVAGTIIGIMFCLCCCCGIGAAIAGGVWFFSQQRRPAMGAHMAQPGIGMQPYGQQPYGQQPYGQQPYGQPGYPAAGGAPVPGMAAPPGYAEKSDAGWSTATDPTSGREYQYNAAGETRWVDEQPAAQPAQVQVNTAQPAAQPASEAGWETHTDPATGRQYKHNASTGVTEWL